MKVLFFTKNEEDRVSFEAEVCNLLQLLDYCKANRPELYSKLVKEGLSYTVYKEGAKQAYPIRKEMISSDISDYDILVISEKLYGEAIFTALVAGLTTAIASAAGGLVIGGVVTAGAIATALAVVIVVGLVIALGYIIQALMPNKKLSNGDQDPSESSRIFNGVPNITEQGGSVPVVIGNCLFGGVRIGLKFEPTAHTYTDVVAVADFTAAMNYPSTWLKIA